MSADCSVLISEVLVQYAPHKGWTKLSTVQVSTGRCLMWIPSTTVDIGRWSELFTRPTHHLLSVFQRYCVAVTWAPLFTGTTTPQPFYGPFSGITRVSRCQKRTSGLYGAKEGGSHIDHPAGRHSIRTSVKALKATSAFGFGRRR